MRRIVLCADRGLLVGTWPGTMQQLTSRRPLLAGCCIAPGRLELLHCAGNSDSSALHVPLVCLRSETPAQCGSSGAGRGARPRRRLHSRFPCRLCSASTTASRRAAFANSDTAGSTTPQDTGPCFRRGFIFPMCDRTIGLKQPTKPSFLTTTRSQPQTGLVARPRVPTQPRFPGASSVAERCLLFYLKQ